ncbi:MAG: hypothetical protein EXX96DRAFT_556687 [Benjaminiella poitrasii]|nr:MAG: hypothetical protein EXX96DRAFT_556687 [Benjaminiella poitrasii]
MRLRIRHANGMATLSNISNDQTILKLKQEIIELLSLAAGQDVQLSGGYPPKLITADNDTTLNNTIIRDGDTLNIKIIDSVIPSIKEPERRSIKEGLIETPNGFLTLRVMDDDNSCLFRSIGYVLRNDTSISQELRKVIVEGIKADPVMYSDITLGQPREKYMEWILKPNSWGGAIELAIFSSYFGIEIDSIDVQTGRFDKFGEGLYKERVLIVYSGIHYDALSLSSAYDSPPEFDQTRFSIDDKFILTAAKILVDGLRKKHKYTDIANFTLKCEQCKIGLKGEKDAQEHAAKTGHTHFVEYQ